MTDTKHCDICTERIREPQPDVMAMMNGLDLPVVSYELHRRDTNGYSDTLDICSAECLASAAVGDGHMRGVHEEFEAHRRTQSAPRRRWWKRRSA